MQVGPFPLELIVLFLLTDIVMPGLVLLPNILKMALGQIDRYSLDGKNFLVCEYLAVPTILNEGFNFFEHAMEKEMVK